MVGKRVKEMAASVLHSGESLWVYAPRQRHTDGWTPDGHQSHALGLRLRSRRITKYFVSTIAIRKRKFLNKFSVMHNALCMVFVANAIVFVHAFMFFHVFLCFCWLFVWLFFSVTFYWSIQLYSCQSVQQTYWLTYLVTYLLTYLLRQNLNHVARTFS